jgi:hypothetical protein
VTRQKHEVKPVFNLIDAVLNGDTGHVHSCKGCLWGIRR